MMQEQRGKNALSKMRGPSGSLIACEIRWPIEHTALRGSAKKTIASTDASWLRSFAPAISMVKSAEPGIGDHCRPRAKACFPLAVDSACPYRGNREYGLRGGSSRSRE